MGDLGRTLREARARKGCSWTEIGDATSIWPEYILALEEEDYSKFSGAAHLRSCLRLYARYLGLDVPKVMGLLERGMTAKPQVSERTAVSGAGFAYPALLRGLLVSGLVLLLAAAGLYGYRRLSTRGGSARPSVPGAASTGLALSSPSPRPQADAYLPISSTSLPLYTITATLDYEGHGLEVLERIDYANSTAAALEEIVLNVYPNHQAGVFTLNGLTLELGTGPVTVDYSLEDMTLSIPLARQLAPGQVVTLFLDFSLDLPFIDPAADFTAGSLGWSTQVVDGGHWYPALAPHVDGGGWYTFRYHPVGDPYVMTEADYDVRIRAPAGVVVLGSGREEREGNLWRYTILAARSFAFAASDEYVQHAVQAGDTTVTSYYFAQHEDAGVAVAELAAEAVEAFAAQFGAPYPYADYRVAETEFAGGMEFSGLSFLGSLWYDTYLGSVRSQLMTLLAHEVSHQWWYGLVGNDQVMEPWLDESLATFSGLLFYELNYPDDYLWAWEFEVFNWQPTGKVDLPIYEFADEASYMSATYRRGAMFLADLRNSMGREAFDAFLRDYCQSQSHKLSTAADFFSILSRHTDEDLSPLLEEYFTQAGGEGTP